MLRFPQFLLIHFRQRETHAIYFDALVVGLNEASRDGRKYRVLYEAGDEAGETEWLSQSELCLAFPAKTLALEEAKSLFSSSRKPVPVKISELPENRLAPGYLRCWIRSHPLPQRVQDLLACASGRNVGVVDRVLAFRDSDDGEKEYRIKWAGCSYRMSQYVPRRVLAHVALAKLLRFERMLGLSSATEEMGDGEGRESASDGEGSDADTYEGIRAEWMQVDRVVDSRAGASEYLVKWRGLEYGQATWEPAEGLSASDRVEVEKYWSRTKEYRARAARKSDAEPAQSKVMHFEEQPAWLKGGCLFDYQLEGLNWMLKKVAEGTNVMLADEMGLGKTVQVAALVGALVGEGRMSQKPVLIVVPLSTLGNWKREVEGWCPHLNFLRYSGSAEDRKLIRSSEFDPDNLGIHKFHVLCTSYEIAVQDSSLLKRISWKLMVVDEGQRLKGGSRCLLFEQLLLVKTERRILVTGTPLQNNLDELFNLLQFLNSARGGPRECTGRESIPTLDEFSLLHQDSSPEEKIESLKALLNPFVLRRLKKNQDIKLVPRVERLVPLRLTALQREYYTAILTKNYRILNGLDKGNRKTSLLNVLMELRKCCAHPYLFDSAVPNSDSSSSALSLLIGASSKLEFLDQILERLRREGHRVLIFSQFTRMLDLLEEYMVERRLPFARIDGSIAGEERQKRIDAFNAPESSTFVFLLSTRAGGLGINLASADTVIVYDSDFNPHRDIQALSRAHRIGQRKTVLVLRLVCKATVEEGILNAAKRKLVLESVVVNSMAAHQSSACFTKEEVEDILQHGAQSIIQGHRDQMKREDGELNSPVGLGQASVVEHRPFAKENSRPGSPCGPWSPAAVGSQGPFRTPDTSVRGNAAHPLETLSAVYDADAIERLLDRFQLKRCPHAQTPSRASHAPATHPPAEDERWDVH